MSLVKNKNKEKVFLKVQVYENEELTLKVTQRLQNDGNIKSQR